MRTDIFTHIHSLEFMKECMLLVYGYLYMVIGPTLLYGRRLRQERAEALRTEIAWRLLPVRVRAPALLVCCNTLTYTVL